VVSCAIAGSAANAIAVSKTSESVFIDFMLFCVFVQLK
jgi:hypothetical protein